MDIGTPVKVANRNQINYPSKGIIIEKETSPCGTEMSKVQFSTVAVWYADTDLKPVKSI